MNMISTYDYDLEIDSSISNIYKIRNSRLWAILEDKTLLYSDLSYNPKPFVKIFSNLTDCEAIFVSPDGEFCLVRTKTDHFHILIQNLIPQQSPIMPGTKVISATFSNIGKYPKPILFMGTDTGTITYFNLNQPITSTNLLPIMISPPTPIDGISIVLFPENLLRFSIITANKIIPKTLSADDFLEIEMSNIIIPQIPRVDPTKIFCESNLIGILSDKDGIAFEFIVNHNSVNPRQLYYMVSKQACGFCMFEEFMLLFTKNGEINVYLNNSENELETLTIKDTYKFDYDADTGELYAVFEKKISKARPNFYINFLSIIARKFIALKKFEEAASLIIKMKFLSFYEMLQFAGNNIILRFFLFKNILEKMKQDKTFSSQKFAIAHSTVLYYAQIESMKLNPNVNEFCKFIISLVNDGLIDIKLVYNILEEYGWTDPIPFIADPYLSFNLFFKTGQSKQAVEYLPKIEDQKNFAKAASRVFPLEREKVIQVIINRKENDDSQFIPILMSEEAHKIGASLIQNTSLQLDWMKRIYCLLLSENPNKNLIENFLKSHVLTDKYSNYFLIRSMIASKQYLILAYGLNTIYEYSTATLIASREDPSFAFDLVAKISDSEIRKRCATRILRTLKMNNESGKIAQKLLSKIENCGIDATLLMQFLPKDTPNINLQPVIEEINSINQKCAKEQQENMKEALSGYKKAEKLSKHTEEKAITLPSTTLCEKCRKPLFTEPLIVYPCSHVLHQKCAEDLINYIHLEREEEAIDYKLDCPICGFLSIRLINQPFRKNNENSNYDSWTINREKLLSTSIKRRKSSGFIPKIEKV